MSFVPSLPEAREAFDAIVRKDRSWPGYIYPGDISREALRELLIAVVCPIPCVGAVNDTGWHLNCEARADAALAALS